MFNIIKHFGSGKLSMAEILAPAIKLAEEGVATPVKSSIMWNVEKDMFQNSRNAEDILNGCKAPTPGEILYNPKLAKCLREIGETGPEVFYNGKIAKNIVEEVTNAGGSLTLEDMRGCLSSSATSSPIDALYVDFHGFRIWGMKPNTMGIVTLVGLKILNLFDLKSLEHNSAEYIHIVSETIKYAYLECWDYLCDPDYCLKPLDELLSAATANKIQNAISSESALKSELFISTGGNTSYTAVVDEEGNGCSFIFSISSRFGSGIIPDDCGFALHDRGKCMSLKKESPNAYGPGKLPLHTIIPALITDPSTGDLLGVFGVMGRWMQPQGQIQVLLNMVVFGMDPQIALNQPRFFIGNPSTFMKYVDSYDMLYLEEGISPTVVPLLQKKGHETCKFVSDATGSTFGRGHVIAHPVLWNRSAKEDENIWWAGADPRSDGHAMGL
ncbi:glutathione hydrolase-like YwrD proenzyme [Uloborus diversus]|uniref:glutathione hydrolase-like YwrD proenzyme n=1 Tax=Uloborus diversus TaxID=327109 RepID=UPI0024094D7D|nr:glutathione hydrolase-like YwrD proenzyme [Uloborus diversus]